MNKAFEKILERLENMRRKSCISEIKGYCQATISRAEDIVQEVAEEYNSGWIPCSDRLPEEYGEYLIWWTDITGKQCYEITEYEPVGGWIGDIPQAVEGIYNVIAWQPLPEPYKESE